MIETKEWGEYFPAHISPFAYNESMAQDYFPLTKLESLAKGYAWYERPERDYKITLQSIDIPHKFEDTDKNIINEVIECSSQYSPDHKEKYPLCTTAFNIVPIELTFYEKMKIPIPDKCFPCRRQDRFALRNPRKLWHRSCMNEGCQNEFETSYAPDRAEIVYCESCYQQEVV